MVEITTRLAPKKAVVLSSGGIDSTTCLGLAVKKFGKSNVASLSVFYGQRHEKELDCALKVAQYYDVPHYTLDLSDIFAESSCSLLKDSENDIPMESYSEQLKKADHATTYVPFRNGLMLSAAASYAMSIFEDEHVVLLIGAHSDDAAGNAYPDCSVEFIKAINDAIILGSDHYVEISAPFAGLHKKDVVKCGLELGVPYHLTWSCYAGGKYACGRCGTCLDRIAAFKANGTKDPITYEWVDYKV